MDFVYRFPVVRGLQAGTEYYIAMVPLKMLSKLFPVDEEEFVLPEYRAQRKLNEARIPIISKYILDNRDSYVFSALAASIDGMFSYEPSSQNADAGVLEVGKPADITVFSTTEQWTVDRNKFYTKGKVSPFDGMIVTGKAKLTVVDGNIVMKEGVVL